jgi:hypothetical protein
VSPDVVVADLHRLLSETPRGIAERWLLRILEEKKVPAVVRASLEQIKARHGVVIAGGAVEVVAMAANGAAFLGTENKENAETFRALQAIDEAISAAGRAFLSPDMSRLLRSTQDAVRREARVVASRPRYRGRRPPLDPMLLGDRYIGRDGLAQMLHDLGIAKRNGKAVVAHILALKIYQL